MTLGTIIAIVLGIAVLVFLIFGFSTGWNNLWERVTAFGGGSANVDTIVQSCALACTTQSTDAYCRQIRTVTLGDGLVNKTLSCKGLISEVNFTKGDVGRMVNIGVDDCSGLCS